jgi:hypothetical protein
VRGREREIEGVTDRHNARERDKDRQIEYRQNVSETDIQTDRMR